MCNKIREVKDGRFVLPPSIDSGKMIGHCFYHRAQEYYAVTLMEAMTEVKPLHRLCAGSKSHVPSSMAIGAR